MAKVKPAYTTASALTITLSALASSATLVAGRSSAAVANTSTLYSDVLVSGNIRVHASTPVTINTQIQVWVWAILEDDGTPTYPDTITGSDAAVTLTSAGIRDAALRLGAAVLVDATTANRVYSIAPFSVADLFGGRMPRQWGVWVPHSTGQPLDSGTLWMQPVEDDIV